jgi:hypothetical protein
MHKQHKTLCYEYKNATLLEKEMFTILIFDVNGMKGLWMQIGFKSWIIGSIFGTFVSNNGEGL